jgi:hypothetical protein
VHDIPNFQPQFGVQLVCWVWCDPISRFIILVLSPSSCSSFDPISSLHLCPPLPLPLPLPLPFPLLFLFLFLFLSLSLFRFIPYRTYQLPSMRVLILLVKKFLGCQKFISFQGNGMLFKYGKLFHILKICYPNVEWDEKKFLAKGKKSTQR